MNFALDLHVLGLPPAFVLSQDQTLQFKLGDTPKSVDMFAVSPVLTHKPDSWR